MSETPFVGRDDEIARLNAYLEAALVGRGQICFVSGEPGSGKTALLREFAGRAEARRDDLLVAVGDCNAQIGAGEPFLPFREVLGLLTGDAQVTVAGGALSKEGATRVQRFAAAAALVLVDTAPDLIGLFVPGAGLAAKVGQAVAKRAGVDSRLLTLMKRQPARSAVAQPALEREHIFEQYSRFLLELAERQPLVIVLDDLQWVDTSSAELLFHLSRRIQASRILLVGAYRPVDVSAGRPAADGPEAHPLEKVLAEVKRYYGPVAIDLDAREPAASRQFVHALVDAEPNALLSDFRENLYQRTGGNPLFVLELLGELRERGYLRQDAAGRWVADPRLDWEALPARIEGVIEGRIGRLDKSLRETVTVASVEGDQFAAEVVARVMAITEREAVRRFSEELARQHRLVDPAGVLRLGAARISLYHFHQRLLRGYLYDHLDAAERAYLHEDIARALEALYQEQTDDIALQLAWHYEEAGLDEPAARYYRRAGEAAAARYAHAEALAHLTRSLQLTPEREVRPRCDLLLAREAVYERLGRRQDQAQDLVALAAFGIRLKDPRLSAEIALRRANLARVTASYANAWTYAQEAIAGAGKAGDALLETQGYALLGLILRHQGSFREAGEWLELALDQAQSLDEEGLAGQMCYWVGLNHYSADRLAAARESVLRASASFAKAENRMGHANCTLLLGTMAVREGDNGEAIRQLEQALTEVRQIGWRSREAFVLGDLANVQLESGNDALARRYLGEALVIAREVGDREGEAVYLDSLGLVEHQLGRYREAMTLYEQALQVARDIGYRRGEGYYLTHLGYAHLELGEYEAAHTALNGAVALRYDLADGMPTVVDNLAALARVAFGQEQLDRARSYAWEALDRIEEHGPNGVEYPVRVYLDCYRVLAQVGRSGAQERAIQGLAAGYALLQKRVASVQDPALREAMLTRVPHNRELREAYERLAARRAA